MSTTQGAPEFNWRRLDQDPKAPTKDRKILDQAIVAAAAKQINGESLRIGVDFVDIALQAALDWGIKLTSLQDVFDLVKEAFLIDPSEKNQDLITKRMQELLDKKQAVKGMTEIIVELIKQDKPDSPISEKLALPIVEYLWDIFKSQNPEGIPQQMISAIKRFFSEKKLPNNLPPPSIVKLFQQALIASYTQGTDVADSAQGGGPNQFTQAMDPYGGPEDLSSLQVD